MEFYKIIPYLLWLMSLFFIGQALFVFIRKKPLIINTIWMVALFSLCFLPAIFSSIGVLFNGPSFVEILSSLLFLASIIWIIFIMNGSGYSIMGADDADFQKSFYESLKDKNYDFEQNLSTVKIKKPEFELQVAIQPWMGTVYLRPKRKANRYILDDLMRDLGKKDIKVNYISPIIFATIGGMILLLAIN